MHEHIDMLVSKVLDGVMMCVSTSLICAGGCGDGATRHDGAGGASASEEPAQDEDVPGDDDDDAAPPSASGVCDAALAFAHDFGAPTECDAAFAAACTNVVGTLRPDYLAAIEACIEGGGTPMDCVVSSLETLTPTAAHRELASEFCDECVLALPGCEEAFFFGEDDQLGVGMPTLPLSDEVVREITEACTSGLTCAAELPTCVQGVLEARLWPDEVVGCLTP